MDVLAVSRVEAGYPVGQQLGRMANASKTECYSNASISLLLANPVMCDFIAKVGGSGSALIKAFHELSASHPSAILSGRRLRSELVRTMPHTALYDTYTSQEDSSLFLVDLLAGLEKEMPATHRATFLGMFQLTVTVDSVCSSGHHFKQNSVDYSVLTLPVADAEANLTSLTECFSHFKAPQVVDCRCSLCPSVQDKQTSRFNSQDPEVLLVSFVRFNNAQQKLGHAVHFEPFLPGQSDDRRYVLTGMVLHEGSSIQSGHYTTIVRCAASGSLYLLNDDNRPQQISQTESNLQKLYQQAVILMFTKEDKVLDKVNQMAVLGDQLQVELDMLDDAVPCVVPSTVSCHNVESEAQVMMEEGADELDESEKNVDHSQPATTQFLTTLESDYIKLRQEIGSRCSVPARERTKEESRQLTNLKAREKRLRPKFSHLEHLLQSMPAVLPVACHPPNAEVADVCPPSKRGRAEEVETSEAASSECFTTQQLDYIKLRRRIDSIAAVSAKQRTNEQSKELKSLKKKEKKN